MSPAAVSTPAGVEPNQHQPPFATASLPCAPAPRQISPADIHAQPVPPVSPRLVDFELPRSKSSQQLGASSSESSVHPTSRANFQGSMPASPPMAPLRDGSLPYSLSSDNVANPSSPQEPAPLFGSPPLLGRPRNALPSATSARCALEATPEYCELAEAVKRTSPHVVRLVVRNLYNLCLLGSEYHLAFLTHTAFHKASMSTLTRAVHDFGEKMVKSSKQHILAHLTTEDFDEVADAILAKASNDFLDKGMARRLETIPARELVNALARAERLGYDVQDIVEEKTANGPEHVVPCLDPMTTIPLQSQALASQMARPHEGAEPAPAPPRPVIGTQSARAPRDLSIQPHKSTDPHGVVTCPGCGRPCSGEQALRYHITRRACEHTQLVERIGKDICLHCGCLFVSSGGLTYHAKSKVCGDYTEAVEKTVLAQLQANGTRSSLATGATPSMRTANPSTPRKTPGQMAAAVSGSKSLSSAEPSHGYSSPADGPYAHLGPEERRSFEMEMKQAEEKYGGLMREAMKLPPAERETELTKIKNSYNSKQSTTRKKYGIRLRERRSKAEIESERSRLFGVSGNDVSAPLSKRPRLDEGQSPSRGPESRPAAVTGGPSGGLAGSSGPAEHTDPTTLLTPPEPRGIAEARAQLSSKGTLGDPMQVDDDSSDETDSDDDDIPATVSNRAA